MKLCKDCQHFKGSNGPLYFWKLFKSIKYYNFAECTRIIRMREKLPETIYGKKYEEKITNYCSIERKDFRPGVDTCGPEGKYFEV